MVRLRHDMICIVGGTQPKSHLGNTTFHTHHPANRFTYCHDQFPETAIECKHRKYDPLIGTCKQKNLESQLIHKQSIVKLKELYIPTTNIKHIMISMHQNAIKYLVYLILNNIKLDQRQAPMMRPSLQTQPHPPTHPLTTLSL